MCYHNIKLSELRTSKRWATGRTGCDNLIAILCKPLHILSRSSVSGTVVSVANCVSHHSVFYSQVDQFLLGFHFTAEDYPQHQTWLLFLALLRQLRGKTRVYLCRPCNVRHAAPTGTRCPIAQAMRGVPSSSKTLGLKRTAPRRTSVTAKTPARPRGRPRKVPAAELPPPAPRRSVEVADHDLPPPLPAILSTDDDTDDASFDDFLPCSQTPTRKRVGSPLFPSAPKRHAPVPAPRRVRPLSAACSPASTRTQAGHRSPPNSPPRSPQEDLGTQLILRQLAAMQETNRREFARIEAEGQRECIKLQVEHRATTETLQFIYLFIYLLTLIRRILHSSILE